MLPEVSNVHRATLHYMCVSPGNLQLDYATTESGLKLYYARGAPTLDGKLPASLRIETLRESGAPEVLTDNSKQIHDLLFPPTLAGGGCSVASEASSDPPIGPVLVIASLALAGAFLLLLSRQRRS